MKKLSSKHAAIGLVALIVGVLFVSQLSSATTSKPIFLRVKKNLVVLDGVISTGAQVKIGSFVIYGSSMDDATITSVALKIYDTSVSSRRYTNVTNLTLKAESSSGEAQIAPSMPRVKNSTKIIFNDLVPFVVEKDSTRVVNIYGDVEAGKKDSTLQAIIETKGIKLQGVTKNIPKKAPIGAVKLQKMRVENDGLKVLDDFQPR